MHANRILYTLPQYQSILRERYNAYGCLIYNKREKKFHAIKPIPKTPFLPEGRKRYFSQLYNKTRYLNKAKKYTFCTLTYSATKYTPSEAAERIKHDLDLFFKRLNYRKSKPEYFYVIELTKQFMVHVHLIFDRYVHKKKIFKSWFKVTGCTATKIKNAGFKNAMQYVTKYITKSKKMKEDYWGFIFGNIDRIWTSSRNFFSKNPNEEKNIIGIGFGSNILGHFIRFFDNFEKDTISEEMGDFQVGCLIAYLRDMELLYWKLPDEELIKLGIPQDVLEFRTAIVCGRK